MKSTFKKTLAALLLAAPIMAGASGGGHYPHVELDPRDQVSLQRGAQIFVNNCLSCHSAAAMRFNRLKDIGLTEDQIKNNLMFTTDKTGDVMQSAMRPEDAKRMIDIAGVDGVMIGRAALANPWMIRQTVHYLETGELLPENTVPEKIEIAKLHLQRLANLKGEAVATKEFRKLAGY